MTAVARLPHRPPRLWAFGLLAWLALALQAVVALPAGHPTMHGAAAAVPVGMQPMATMDGHHGQADCCHGDQAPAHCDCPAACTVAVLTVPDRWILAPLPPASGPSNGPAPAALKRAAAPPLRPPLA